MSAKRPSQPPEVRRPAAPKRSVVMRSLGIDWNSWTRRLNRKRRLLVRRGTPHTFISRDFLVEATAASFRLDGIELTDAEAGGADADAAGRGLRSKLNRRIRSHIAIQLAIGRALLRGEVLKTEWVLRWYTSIAAGLSTTMLAAPKMDRLDLVINRINSPQLRLQPALTEIARLHVEALRDELVPGFNGIMSRLLLQYHLGRCGLPPILMDPVRDDFRQQGEQAMLPRLLEMVDASFERLKAGV